MAAQGVGPVVGVPHNRLVRWRYNSGRTQKRIGNTPFVTPAFGGIPKRSKSVARGQGFPRGRGSGVQCCGFHSEPWSPEELGSQAIMATGPWSPQSTSMHHGVFLTSPQRCAKRTKAFDSATALAAAANLGLWNASADQVAFLAKQAADVYDFVCTTDA